MFRLPVSRLRVLLLAGILAMTAWIALYEIARTGPSDVAFGAIEITADASDAPCSSDSAPSADLAGSEDESDPFTPAGLWFGRVTKCATADAGPSRTASSATFTPPRTVPLRA